MNTESVILPELSETPSLVVAEMTPTERRAHLARIGDYHLLIPEHFTQDSNGKIREVPTSIHAQSIRTKVDGRIRKRRAERDLPARRRVHKKNLSEEAARLSRMARALLTELEEKFGWDEWGQSDVRVRMNTGDKRLIAGGSQSILRLRLILNSLDKVDDLNNYIAFVREQHATIDGISARIWKAKPQKHYRTEYLMEDVEELDFAALYAKELEGLQGMMSGGTKKRGKVEHT